MNKYRDNVIVLFLYTLFSMIMNWSLILGYNTMKWDIWDAQYPIQSIVSDAIRGGEFPLWMPLYDFGMPYYAVIGSPVWYPITILIDIIGYTPFAPGWEYSIHLIIGAYGMYILCKSVLLDECGRVDAFRINAISFIVGVFYEFSGVFLSNAEHIMIVISAAWIPFVFWGIKGYIKTRKKFLCCLSGLFAGMILLGGYPEILYDLFLVLFFLICYWRCKFSDKNESLLHKLQYSIIHYMCVVACTMLSSSITLIPFINVMNEITRSAVKVIYTQSYDRLLSSIFPIAYDKLYLSVDVSMGCYYVGILPLLVFFVVGFSDKKCEWFFLVIAIISLFTSFGDNFFLYPLMHKVLPLYSSFRFPPVFRIFFFVFLLLAAGVRVMCCQDWQSVIARLKKVCILASVLFFMYLFCREMKDIMALSNIMFIESKEILLSAERLLITLWLYYVVGMLWQTKKILGKWIRGVVFFCVIIDVLFVAYQAFPVMVGRYDQFAYFNNVKVKNEIIHEYTSYMERNRENTFSIYDRSSSGVANSSVIAHDKSFDDGGYMSIKLKSINDYKGTDNYNLTKQNDVIFFTDDIVTSDMVDYDYWKNNKTISNKQIYLDRFEKKINSDSSLPSVYNIEVKNFSFNEIELSIESSSNGVLTLLQAYYPGWNAYVDGEKASILKVDKCFMGLALVQGKHNVLLKFLPVDFYVGFLISILFYLSLIYFYKKENIYYMLKSGGEKI